MWDKQVRSRVAVLVINLFTLIVIGFASALLLLFRWTRWNPPTKLQLAAMAVAGLACGAALVTRWNGLRWLWLGADFVVSWVTWYVLTHDGQQLDRLTGWEPLLWGALITIWAPTFAVLALFRRLDGARRWMTVPDVLRDA
jgi:hypothetical protein